MIRPKVLYRYLHKTTPVLEVKEVGPNKIIKGHKNIFGGDSYTVYKVSRGIKYAEFYGYKDIEDAKLAHLNWLDNQCSFYSDAFHELIRTLSKETLDRRK
jgi:hypothetical protein